MCTQYIMVLRGSEYKHRQSLTLRFPVRSSEQDQDMASKWEADTTMDFILANPDRCVCIRLDNDVLV